jgi:hypothetical protein
MLRSMEARMSVPSSCAVCSRNCWLDSSVSTTYGRAPVAALLPWCVGPPGGAGGALPPVCQILPLPISRYRFKFQSNLVWDSIKSISNFCFQF